MTRITSFVRGNAIALVALFIALGGTSYAAVVVPRNSVGPRQLRNGAVTPAKLAGGSFGGRILDFAEIESDGAVSVSDPRGIRTKYWNLESASPGGLIVFPRRIPSGCYPMATPATPFAPGSTAPPSVSVGINSNSTVILHVSGPVLTTLTVVCPTR
jgi:hypothetical protein